MREISLRGASHDGAGNESAHDPKRKLVSSCGVTSTTRANDSRRFP